MNKKNFLNRSLIALIYSSIFLICLFYNSTSFGVLGIIITVLVIREFSRICNLSITKSIFGIFFYFTLTFLSEYISNFIFILLGISILTNIYLLFTLIMNKSFRFKKIPSLLLLLFHITLSLFFLFQLPILNNSYEPIYILFLLIIVWTSDSAGYFFGIKFGKRKLMKSISPKKTIEGLAASLFFSMIISLIFGYISEYKNLIEIVVIGIFISVLGSIGDLIESKFKRQSGVKDSGNLLKSHGGLYDRLDSLIFTAPFIYLLYFLNILKF
ncbi:MAG: phosphatidate cytidylyltransferase [Bacteroidota bacterium]|nr:phosphatidate cytidylyltransferase [Bacteroidota bacterium]